MVNGLLYANAACRPDPAALVYGEHRIGHAELLDRVERTAHGLAERGIRAGDAVAVVLPNGPDFVTAFFAIAGLRAVVVPLNPQFRPDELAFCLRACQVRAVIAEQPAAGADGPRWLTPGELLASDSLALEICSAGEPCVFQFSSGSTGRRSGWRARTGSCGRRRRATPGSTRTTGCFARSRSSTPTRWDAA